MKVGGESRTRRAECYVLALVFAMLSALGAAVPAFAAEETAGEGTVQPKIVGGTSVPDGKYKFVAALRDVTLGNSTYQQQFCGGTLIDRDSVLTAAHCVEGITAARLGVTVGITSLKERQGQARPVGQIFRHPKYTNSEISYRYDAAVLKLGRPVQNIEPVEIPTRTSNALETPGRSATIAGWGNTRKQSPGFREPDSYPFRMQEAQVPIVSDSQAKSVYGSEYVPSLMLAAGREGKDACQGDSGGPIFVKKDTGRFLQIGITSFGAGCGARDLPTAYAETNSDGIRPFVYGAARK